jgi:hypothetical protein
MLSNNCALDCLGDYARRLDSSFELSPKVMIEGIADLSEDRPDFSAIHPYWVLAFAATPSFRRSKVTF